MATQQQQHYYSSSTWFLASRLRDISVRSADKQTAPRAGTTVHNHHPRPASPASHQPPDKAQHVNKSTSPQARDPRLHLVFCCFGTSSLCTGLFWYFYVVCFGFLNAVLLFFFLLLWLERKAPTVSLDILYKRAQACRRWEKPTKSGEKSFFGFSGLLAHEKSTTTPPLTATTQPNHVTNPPAGGMYC